MRWAGARSKLPPICTRRLLSESNHVWRVEGYPPPPSLKTIRRHLMSNTEVAVVPAAFALLTAMLMFAGPSKRFGEAGRDRAVVIGVGLFLLSTMIVLAIISI